MRAGRLSAAVALVVHLLAAPLAAQTGPPSDPAVDLEEVRELRDATAQNVALSDELRAQVVGLYDDAIRSLEVASDHEAAAVAAQRERSGIPGLVEELEAELDLPESRPRLDLPEDATVVQAEDALTRARARLGAHRSALRDQQRLSEDRTSSRNEIAQRLGSLEHELELLNDELRKQAESTAGTELKEAGRLSMLARQEAASSEGRMHRASLALLGDRARLNPLETDLAQRRVAHSEEMVALVEKAAHELRAERARQSLERMREQCRRASEEIPEIAPIAAEVEELAELLFGLDGVVTRTERAASALAATRRHQVELNRIAELTRRQFEAYEDRGSIIRWWPDTPEDFPRPGAVAAAIQGLDEEIPEVEHQLISYEQRRSGARALARQTMLEIETAYGDDLDVQTAQGVRELLDLRQDLLDALIQRGGRYSNQLVEYRTVAANFYAQLQKVERFLYAHILWSRSVPRPLIPRPSAMSGAAGWLTSTEHLQALPAEMLELHGIRLLPFLVLIVLVRRPLRHRLHEIAKKTSGPEGDSLRFTIEALVITTLLAAPLPMALHTGSIAMASIGACRRSSPTSFPVSSCWSSVRCASATWSPLATSWER